MKIGRLVSMLRTPKNGVPRKRAPRMGRFAPYVSAKRPASGLDTNEGATAAIKISAAPRELRPYRSFTSIVIPASNKPQNANATYISFHPMLIQFLIIMKQH